MENQQKCDLRILIIITLLSKERKYSFFFVIIQFSFFHAKNRKILCDFTCWKSNWFLHFVFKTFSPIIQSYKFLHHALQTFEFLLLGFSNRFDVCLVSKKYFSVQYWIFSISLALCYKRTKVHKLLELWEWSNIHWQSSCSILTPSHFGSNAKRMKIIFQRQ